jgi:hypothetical protein
MELYQTRREKQTASVGEDYRKITTNPNSVVDFAWLVSFGNVPFTTNH